MSKFKNHPKIKLIYTDTDSIYTNLNPEQMNTLSDSEFISSTGLGKLKLETVSSRAIFLAPKIYFLKTIDGEEISKIIKTQKISLNGKISNRFLTLDLLA